MANPNDGSQYSTSTSPDTSLYYIDALNGGVKWGDAAGTGADLTFSFPWATSSTAYWADDYGSGELDYDLNALSGIEQTAVREALALWATFADLSFTEISDSTAVGDLRFAWTGYLDPDTAAWAYYPDDYYAQGGDVWLLSNSIGGNGDEYWLPDHYGFNVILHEIGHALGLKHPFEGSSTLPTGEDSYQYSLMSYTQGAGYGYTYPSTPMLYDIAAIQYLYGANMSYHASDDTYTFTSATPAIQTIWDAGGNDTFSVDGANYGCTISLQDGEFSNIRVDSGSASLSNNISIAFGVTIENAVGGNGNDQITGNESDNFLCGGKGNDTLEGDTGLDTAVFSGNRADYTITKTASGFTVLDGVTYRDGLDTVSNIEKFQFADQTVNAFENSITLTISTSPTFIDTAGDDSFSTTSGNLAGQDIYGNTLSYGIGGGTTTSGVATQIGTYGTLSVDTISGTYSFTPNDSAIEALKSLATESFTVTATDGAVSTSQTLVIRIQGADDLATLSGTHTGNVREDGVSVTGGTLSINDRDNGDNRFIPTVISSNFGSLSIDDSGNWTYILDNTASQDFQGEREYTDSFHVSTTSGESVQVVISITGEYETDSYISLAPTTQEGVSYIGGDAGELIRSTALSDKINAGNGDNVILAGDGNNRVTAGSGNDDIITGNGNDKITAGDGNNFIKAGDGNNTVTTGDGHDEIVALGGNDKITAGGGANIIDAGEGNNAITTLGGDDSISTGTGNDKISSGDGNNYVVAGNGIDTVLCGSGNDEILAGAGNDFVKAGVGNDLIYGGEGADTLSGGAGNDRFVFDSLEEGVYDTITDFGSGDTLVFDLDIFTKLASPIPGYLSVSNTPLEADDFLVYDRYKGILFYDEDGAGLAESAVKIAVIKGSGGQSLTFNDFLFT